MKRFSLFIMLSLGFASLSHAIEILRWDRLPLAVSLVVGQERVLLIDRNKMLRVGVPAHLKERLRIQSAGGAVYLLANAPIEPSRLQLQDAASGEIILLDITAKPGAAGQSPLEPIKIVDAEQEDRRERNAIDQQIASGRQAATATPIPAVLTRYAAQSLYAPLRTVEPLAGVTPVPLRRDLAVDTLLPTVPVQAVALAAWRLDNYWVTAVKLTHIRNGWIHLDPRSLQGDFIAATFQHPNLGPAGNSTDTTVAYLVTRSHGLAESLLPAINRIDGSLNMPSVATEGRTNEK